MIDISETAAVFRYERRCVQLVKLLLAASQGDVLALERAYVSGIDMNAADYDNR